MKLLVKDFGHGEMCVYGFTFSEDVAKAWEQGDSSRCIELPDLLNPNGTYISKDPLPLAEYVK